MDFFRGLVDPSGFTPRGHRAGWGPELVWLHNGADALIRLAYLAIPAVLVYFIRRRRDMPFPLVFWLFGAFILGCGLTHLMEVITSFTPLYRLAALVKVLTAVASWATVLALVRVTPRALDMRGPEALGREIEERKRAEGLLRRQTAFLRLLQEVTVAANEADTIEEALRVCLDRVCACTGWQVGHVYLFPANSGGESTPLTLWSLADARRFGEFPRAAGGPRPPPASRLLRRVLVGGKPAWVRDVAREATVAGADVAGKLGLRAAFAFPVLTGKEVAAVLEFYSTQAVEPDEALLEVMGNLGTQLGRVIERARAREALRQSETRFRSVAQSAHDAIVSADGNGTIISWNNGARATFGYAEEEVLGKPLTLLMPPRHRAAHQKGLERLRSTGAPRLLGKTVELQGLRKDGREFPLELSLARWEADGGTFYTGIIRDVTERRQAEAALRDSEQRFRLLVEAVKDYAIYMLDPAGHVVTWNAGAERIKGYRPEEIVGRHFSTFYTPEEVRRGRPQEELRLAAAEGRFEEEGWRVRQDGSRFWASAVLTAVRDEGGQLRGFAKVTRDVSERKRAEEEVLRLNRALGQWAAEVENANKELEAFSYSVSHDLRAPLRAMDGFSRILLEDHAPSLPGEAQRYLRLVRDNARQMGQLIDDLLRFARLSRQPLQKRAVAPADLVRQVLDGLGPEQQGRRVAVRVGDLPPCQADPALLKQVFANLLGNALKYTRAREEAVIEVGVGRGGAPGEPAYFVRDNGVGFDMRYAHKLFGVFQRLHRAEEYEGTGVGLATVQRIVRRHGGRVWAEAEVDRGATFHFTLGGGPPHE